MSLSSFSLILNAFRVRPGSVLLLCYPKANTSHAVRVCVCEREAVISTQCFLTHEWVFVARAVKIEPSRAHLCPASATSFAAASPQVGQSVELKSGL